MKHTINIRYAMTKGMETHRLRRGTWGSRMCKPGPGGGVDGQTCHLCTQEGGGTSMRSWGHPWNRGFKASVGTEPVSRPP